MITAARLPHLGAALLMMIGTAGCQVAEQRRLTEVARIEENSQDRSPRRSATGAGSDGRRRLPSAALLVPRDLRPMHLSTDALLIASISDPFGDLLRQSRLIRHMTRPFRTLDKRSAGRDASRIRTRHVAGPQSSVVALPVIARLRDIGARPVPTGEPSSVLSPLTSPDTRRASDRPGVAATPRLVEGAAVPAVRAGMAQPAWPRSFPDPGSGVYARLQLGLGLSPDTAETRRDRQPALQRLMQVLAALAFLALSGVLAFRWKADANRLRLRLRSEQAVYAAIAGLSPDAATPTSTVADVLLRIEDCFGFRSAALVSLDPSTWSIEALHAANGETDAAGRLADEIIAEIRLRDDPWADMLLWRYPERAAEPPARTVSQLVQGSRPDAVASVVWLGERLGVVLIARCGAARSALAADTQILHLATQLLAIVTESGGRPAQARLLSGRLDDGRENAGRPEDGPAGTSAAQRRDTGRQPVDGSSTLASGIAHEFNNVLTAIMGYAEMAAERLHPGTSPRTYVDHIQGAGARAKLVIDQMLAFSREDPDARTTFNVVAATAEILKDLTVSVSPSVMIRAKLPDRPLRIHGSRVELQQVVTNLCKNAGEAMLDGGEVTIGISAVEIKVPRVLTHGWLEAGRYVRVSVNDTGAGIATANLGRIFHPFFTTRSGKGGTGLGLAMVLRIVQAMDGGLNVRSTVGSGTRFELFFPRVVKAASRPVSEKLPGSRPRVGDAAAGQPGRPEKRSTVVWEQQAPLAPLSGRY